MAWDYKGSILGPQGDAGPRGSTGDSGSDGKSAYEIAVDNGFEGDEFEWLMSLKGEPGSGGGAQADWNATSGPSEILNKPDLSAVIDGLLEGEVTPEDGVCQLLADRYHVIDGTQTVTLLLPDSAVQGDRVAIYIEGTSGEVTLDGNGLADVGSVGTTSVQLVAPGAEKLILTVWQRIDYWGSYYSPTWVMIASYVETTAEFIPGAGEVGLQLLQAENQADAQATLGVSRENPVIVTDAHDATVGEAIICAYGPYTVTIPDGDNHGDTITVITDVSATTGDITAEYFDLTAQDTVPKVVAMSGQQLTLRWIKDIDLGAGIVSGWYTTLADLTTAFSSP